MWEIVFWSVAFILLRIAELQSFQFVSIWFALSSIVALFCAIADVTFTGQVIIFSLVSAMLLIATRPLVKKLHANKSVPTNSELDIGKTAIVIERINNSLSTGRVKLNGVDWAARSVDGSTISMGSTVIVEKIEGSKLIVKK